MKKYLKYFILTIVLAAAAFRVAYTAEKHYVTAAFNEFATQSQTEETYSVVKVHKSLNFMAVRFWDVQVIWDNRPEYTYIYSYSGFSLFKKAPPAPIDLVVKKDDKTVYYETDPAEFLPVI